ncbi:MAG: secretin N-terminal domain-containing protein [Candidatus Omnitrophica bacterium]|nr:secretin N-terminal domain-containing protein [Candidatus Omnitrophota bacterium]
MKTNKKCFKNAQVILYMLLLVSLFAVCPTKAFAVGPLDQPKTIVFEEKQEPLEERINRKITLDVRDMNIIDVIKFLAIKGDFNVVTSKSVEGRVTLYLKSVSIEDALDIILISNALAFKIQNDIVHVMSETEYVATYGRKFNDQSIVKTIHLNYSSPAYALSALESVKSNLGKIVIDNDTGTVVMIDTPEAIARMEKALKEIEKPMETYIYNLQYAKADVLAEKLKARIDGNAVGSVMADERSNQLIVRALPDRREEIMKVIKSLDTKTKEVLIEAQIVQITFNPQYDIGIDWNLDFLDSPDPEIRKLTFDNVYLDKDNLTTSDSLYSKFGQIAIGNIDQDHFTATIRALKQVNDTKILSNPRLLVTNGQEAKIHIGDTIPYIITTSTITGDNESISEDVRFVDVGLKLKVSADINDDGFVTMNLAPEISTVTRYVESRGGGIPQVNKTEVETSVLIKDGTTIIMGGLKKDEKSHSKKGFPVLMDLPFIGKLFSATSDEITKTEIVIFITPRIISGEEHTSDEKGTIKPYKTYGDDDF